MRAEVEEIRRSVEGRGRLCAQLRVCSAVVLMLVRRAIERAQEQREAVDLEGP